jgi:hypothetical protein
MEVSGQLHARPLYPQGKSPWYPLYRRLGGPQSRFRRCGVEKNSQPLSRLKPPIIQLIAKRCTAELSRLILNVFQKKKNRAEIQFAICVCVDMLGQFVSVGGGGTGAVFVSVTRTPKFKFDPECCNTQLLAVLSSENT